jgi:hypothetical protein
MRVASLTVGAVIAIAAPFATGRAFATPYRCVPSVQYACSAEHCVRTTEGFQHAESFSFDPDRGVLGACLWTSCFEGTAQVFRGGDDGSFTVIAALKADGDMATSPRVLSLTVDDKRRFVAVWQYEGTGLTFDQGVCADAESSGAAAARR